jgi:hypothetical protein
MMPGNSLHLSTSVEVPPREPEYPLAVVIFPNPNLLVQAMKRNLQL